MKTKLKEILLIMASFFAGGVATELTVGRERKKSNNMIALRADKMEEFYSVLLQWICVHQQGRTLTSYFHNNGYKTVAIYGMKELGESLLAELCETDVVVKYAVDRDAADVYVEIEVVKPSDILEPVDVMVVTAIHSFSSIQKEMMSKLKCPIVSIEDVVWEA